MDGKDTRKGGGKEKEGREERKRTVEEWEEEREECGILWSVRIGGKCR